MHTPIEVTERALAIFQEFRADCVVALGGGSTTGLGKAIAVRTGRADRVVIPTARRLEMTDILGEQFGEKTTRRDPAILPETVIYDVDLTMSLPASLTVTSGLNAMAHAAEALYALTATQSSRSWRPKGFALSPKRFLASQPTLATAMHARTRSTAWLCGAALGRASMALHHKLCHTLGGGFNLPHAETHAVILPHSIGFNAPAAAELLAPVSAALGGPTSRSSISPRGSALR